EVFEANDFLTLNLSYLIYFMPLKDKELDKELILQLRNFFSSQHLKDYPSILEIKVDNSKLPGFLKNFSLHDYKRQNLSKFNPINTESREMCKLFIMELVLNYLHTDNKKTMTLKLKNNQEL
ncbi:MAG: hypothetical protein MHPSP_003079, partial [Paramarteilia canceri]